MISRDRMLRGKTGPWDISALKIGAIGWFCAVLSVLTIAAMPNSARAQMVPGPTDPSLAFSCTAAFYEVIDGQLSLLDIDTGIYTPIGPQQLAYNGTGYNQVDNFVYGFGIRGAIRNQLVRIGNDGSLQTLGDLGVRSFAGVFDDTNRLFYASSATSLSFIDVTTGTLGTVAFTPEPDADPFSNVLDYAYATVGGQDVIVGASGGSLMVWNLDTGRSDRFVLDGLPGGSFGAAWGAANGSLYFSNNDDGTIFEVVDVTTNPRIVNSFSAAISSAHDGMACAAAPPPAFPPPPNPDFTLAKSADTSGLSTPLALGDEIVFTFTQVNTGDTDLAGTGLLPVDTMTYGTDGAGAPVATPIVITKVSESIADDNLLEVGETIVYQGTFILDQAAIDAGGVHNTATATGNPVNASGNDIQGIPDVVDLSDNDPAGDGTDGATGGPDDHPTVVTLIASPELGVAKSATVGALQADGTFDVTYTVLVQNTGNVDLTDVTLVDDLTAADQLFGAFQSVVTQPIVSAVTIGSGSTLPANTTSYTGANSLIGTGGVLAVGDSFRVVFTVNVNPNAANQPASGLNNTATASGVPPGATTPVTDASENGADPTINSGNPPSNPNGTPTTVTTPPASPGTISLVKTSVLNDDDGTPGVSAGDTIDYTYVVTNTSALVNVLNVSVSEPNDLTNAFSGTGTVPTPVHDGTSGSDLDGGDGTATDIAVGETVTFTASYTLTQSDIDAGGVTNSAVASGTDPAGNTPTDVSDDGDTSNGADNPTVTPLARAPSLMVTKSIEEITDSNTNNLIDVDDVVTYAFVVTNTGNTALANVQINDLLLSTTPLAVAPANLAPGQSATLTGQTYTIQATDIAAGGVENTASAAGLPVATGPGNVPDPNTPLVDDGGNDFPTVTDTSDSGTQADLDGSGAPLDVVDPENTETPDLAGGTDSDAGNDPTVLNIVAPEITLVKSVANVFDTNNDGLFGGEGDEIEFSFLVRNTGAVDLRNITITDPVVTLTGGPIDLAAGEGNSLAFTGTYVVQAADLARGFIENSASASGEVFDSAGNPIIGLDGAPITVSDTSDAGTTGQAVKVVDPANEDTPDGLGDTDGDPGNDPTVQLLPGNPKPSLQVVKSVTFVDDTNASGTIDAGDTVTYGFAVTNNGNVGLADVVVQDTRAPVTGGPIDLAITEANTTEFQATYVLTAADVAAGGFENTAEASGTAVNSNGDPILDGPGGVPLMATDLSDSGTEPELGDGGAPTAIADPAGNETPALDGSTDTDPTNDPTVLSIPSPGISVVKSVAAAPDTNGDGTFGGINDVLTYSFTVTNTGNTALGNVMVSDPTVTLSGGPINLPVGGVDSTTFTATHILTANDVNVVGFVENSASVAGDVVNASGEPLSDPFSPGTTLSVSDVSDAGTDSTTGDVTDPEGTETAFNGNGDGDPTNDPTITQLPVQPLPNVEVIKSVAAVADTNADAVVGGVDDIATFQFDVTNTGNTFLANVAVNDPVLGGLIGTIPSIAVGETVTLTADYTIVQADEDRGFIENTATADGEAQNPLGTPLLDPITGQPLTASDDSDTATGPSTEPVPNPAQTETPDGAGATDGDPTNDPTILTVPLVVPDTVLSGFVFFDSDTDQAFDPVEDGLAGFIVNLRDSDGNISATAVTDADGFYEFAGFPIGTYNVEFVNPNTNQPIGLIAGLTFARDTVITDQNQAVIGAMGQQLILTKATSLSVVSLGSSVPYTITVENTSTVPATADIVDSLPIGFAYTPGTATIGGVASEPIIAGSALTWTGVTIAAGATETLELVTRVGPGTPTGELVNTVNALDPVTGVALATPATAVVRREAEAVFECSDVIGKVFDDVNFDGYQNSGTGSRLTNQNIFRGKNKVAPPAEGPREPGLPRVRLVTATGTIITTDEYGRYSVPCAELPRDMGSNFTLKLDERSLPTGYRVTTENPRTMRLTAGIMTEMNFGAAIGRVIDIDLTATAFDREDEPVARLTQGIDRLLGQVASQPTVLRLSYFSNGEETREANRKLERLEKHIQARWRKVGNYRLLVERNIKSLQ